MYSFLLACVVLAIRLLYPKLPKRVEYGLWCLVLVRLVLPTDLSFDYALSANFHDWASAFNVPHLSSDILSYNLSDYSTLSNAMGGVSFSLIDIIFTAWLCIVLIVAVSYLSLRLQLIKMLNRSRPIVEYAVLACVNRWRLNFWVKQPVHVIAEDRYLSPFTCYWKTPIIYIPNKILQSNDQVLIESIVAHEMAHVKRRDALWLMLQNIIQIIYFFNPVVWLIVGRLSALRENICDEMVLSTSQLQPVDYGNSLLSVLRFSTSGEIKKTLVNQFLGYKREIKRRISRIARFVPQSRHPIAEISLVLLFAILFLPFTQESNLPLVANSVTVEQDGKKNIEDSPFPEDIERQITLPILSRR